MAQERLAAANVSVLCRVAEHRNLGNELSSYLGLGDRRPDIVVRFGNGPEHPTSLRRPPQQLIL